MTSYAEAQQIVTETDCANRGHEPYYTVRNGHGTAVRSLCECGTVAWAPANQGVTAERDSARRWAVGLEQAFTEIQWRARAALDIAEQLGCTCEIGAEETDVCSSCCLRSLLDCPEVTR